VTSWCRSCGQIQGGQSGPCAACGVDLSVEPPAASPIGLVFEVRGKLGVGKKLGICLSTDGDSFLLHLSPKDKEPARVPNTAQPTDTVPHGLGAATRLLYAANLQEGKQAWDRDLLRSRATEMCGDVRELRRLADDALELRWSEILEWAPLSASEKAWRTAHHAAAGGQLDLLRDSLAQLPPSGYPTRASLLLPYLGAVRYQSAEWMPVLEQLAKSGAPGGEAVKAAAGDWRSALDAAATLTSDPRRTQWAKVKEQLDAGGTLPPSPFHDTPAWTAASLVSSADRSQPINAALEHLVGLEPALWDDLIDEGRITKAAALTSLRGGLRTYVLARLDPEKLSDAELRDVGNDGEYARRLFLSRDKASLSGLADSPRVRHYLALLDVIEGGRPDPSRLDPETIRLLDLPTEVLGQIKDGAVSALPAEVAKDPSLWPIFSDVAISGKLLPDAGRGASDPLNVWIGVHRLLGLIWEGDLTVAVEHGGVLAAQAHEVEEIEDEVLNMSAFALYQLGRVEEALGLLERALQGLYTENLLVNASIVAGRAQPEVGVRYLAKLVEEAPTPELQRAGLDQAIGVWQRTDLDFPQVLVPALRSVLSSEQPIDEYLRLGRVAVMVAPQVVGTLPNPGGELDGPYRLIQIRGRWKTEDSMLLGDLADAYISLYKSVGHVEWFMDDWSTWIDTIRESVFVDFGEAAGSAMFIDKVIMNAPDLFQPQTRFELAAQAGAHLAFAFRRDSNSFLNDAAVAKFFIHPLDEFISSRGDFEPGLVDYLSNNFARCAGLGVLHIFEVQNPQMVEEYNSLNERARWDTQNYIAIQVKKEEMLRDSLTGPISTIEAVVSRLRKLQNLDDKATSLLSDVAGSVSEWRSECERLLRSL